MPTGTATQRILSLAAHQSLVRPRDVEALGIAREFLLRLHRQGLLVRPARGVYALADTSVALTDEFLLDRAKQTQWNAFCRRLGLRHVPPLDVAGPLLVRFLMPAVEQARLQNPDPMIWEPPGPWLDAERTTV